MKLEARHRLRAESPSDHAKDVQKEHLNHQIEQKETQVKDLKHQQPSRENRQKVSPEQRIRNKQQQHTLELQNDSLKLQKSKL